MALAAEHNFMLSAALAAHDAGLCVVPTRDDGTKAPAGAWKQWQTERPPRSQVIRWYANGHPGLGLLCGNVSGGLEMLELEGRAVDEGMWAEFGARCDAAGLGDLLDRIVAGYGEDTPSGGIHVLYRVPTPGGNTKLARRPGAGLHDIDVLFETRGEGGYTIVAPSHGTTHPSGKQWDRKTGGFHLIASITDAERDALWNVCRTFDTMPGASVPAPNPAPTAKPQGLTVATLTSYSGDSWIGDLQADLAKVPWSDVLGRYGWQHAHTDGDVDYWTRPGKAVRDGSSATTNAKGTDRLIVFSSSTPFEQWSGSGPATSYDRLDVIAVYDHAGDRLAAARHLAHRPTPTAPTRNLAPDFWTARPYLAQIRQAAYHRRSSANAVLVCTLACVAAATGPTVKLQTLRGEASLNLFVAPVGRPGTGKTTAADVAIELTDLYNRYANPGFVHATGDIPILALGSGEGMIDAYFEMVAEDNPDGKGKRQVKRQTKTSVLFRMDEGSALGNLASSKTSTIIPTLRSTWSGAIAGQANAGAETKRILPGGSYRAALIIGFQPSSAGAILADAEGGLPQRFLWCTAVDPDISDVPPPWPGKLDWPRPERSAGTAKFDTVVTVEPSLDAELDAIALARSRGEATVTGLDEHRNLLQLKVAAYLALLDGRLCIDRQDWALAGQIMATSDAVRSECVETLALAGRKAEEASTDRLVRREVATASAQEKRALDIMATAIGRHVHRATCEGGCDRRCTARSTSGAHRKLATYDEALDLAARNGWVVVTHSGITPGKSRPT